MNENRPSHSNVSLVQFSIWSPDEIRKSSVAEIYNIVENSFDSSDTKRSNSSKANSLFDPRLGTIDKGVICPTCKQGHFSCPGHFGHIELAIPVFHVHFISNYIQKILNCVCLHCANLLYNFNDPKITAIIQNKKKNNRFTLMYQYLKSSKGYCPHCSAIIPDKIVKEGIKLYAHYSYQDEKDGKVEGRKALSSEFVHLLFSRFTDETIVNLGFDPLHSRPEWMIAQVLPVPPPHVRPSVKRDANKKCEDDLTHKLIDIIRCNNVIKDRIKKLMIEEKESTSVENNTFEESADKNGFLPHIGGYNNDMIESAIELLQNHVATIVDNEIPGLSKTLHRQGGRPLKGIKQRIKSKQGRVRGNLMGKRCDFTARTVISSDPNIELYELGVPLVVAKTLTIPEYVTEENIERLTEMVNRGPDEYPGARSIRFSENIVTSISVLQKRGRKIILRPGNIVDRHLLDGDYVLFNRQPSLHRMSMMCHKVRVLPKGNTFRLNVSVTTPYNADFDGDEMNLHIPQSLQTSIEIYNLAFVASQIITPQKNGPIIGLLQDSLLGIYQITNDNVTINRKEFMQLLITNDVFTGELPLHYVEQSIDDIIRETWTGKEVISTVLPPLTVHRQTGKDAYPIFHMEKGKLTSGRIDKSIVGDGAKNGLIHSTWKDYSPTAAANFIYKTQKLVNAWMLKYGYSVGISDCVVDKDTEDLMHDKIIQAKKDVLKKLEEVHLGIFQRQSSEYTVRQEFETVCMNILNNVTNDVGKTGLSNTKYKNRIMDMVNSGSKGKIDNVAQITGCVGQQSLENSRVPFNYNGRTLPCFYKHENSPESRGFVEHSFKTGIEPYEYFFSAMGGRIGLTDTALKTADTGYTTRKFIKSLEDLTAYYDGTIRNQNHEIVQFNYGNDTFDPIYLEENSLSHFINSTDDEWNDTYICKKKHTGVAQKLINAHEKELKELREMYIRENMVNGRTPFTDVYCPFRLQRLLKQVNQIQSNDRKLDIKKIIERINSILKDLNYFHKSQHTSNKVFQKRAVEAIQEIRRAMLVYLCPATLIQDGYSTAQINFVLDKIIEQTNRAYLHAGECVGIISSQSIGEPTTQMTLNTFHLSGISSGALATTKGVPRIKEIIELSKTPKTPYVQIHMKKEFASNKFTNKYIHRIIMVQIKDLIDKYEVRYMNQGTETMNKHKNFYDMLLNYAQYKKDVQEWLKILPDMKSTSVGTQAVCQDIEKKLKKGDTLPIDYHINVIIQFNREKMLQNEISMIDVYQTIRANGFTNECIFNDDNDKELKMVIGISQVKAKTEFGPLIQKQVYKLTDLPIRGVKCIKYANVVENKTKFKKGEYYIQTMGTNLLDILSLEEVDQYRTISNNIIEIYETFGIEAARECIFMELYYTFVESNITNLNKRHIEILADQMTHSGKLLALNRHGINKQNLDPLSTASFEQTVDRLVRAASHAEVDQMNGVSANIMLGQVVPIGTGFTDILFNENQFQHQIGGKNLKKIKGKQHNILSTDEIIKSMEAKMNYHVPLIQGNMPTYQKDNANEIDIEEEEEDEEKDKSSEIFHQFEGKVQLPYQKGKKLRIKKKKELQDETLNNVNELTIFHNKMEELDKKASEFASKKQMDTKKSCDALLGLLKTPIPSYEPQKEIKLTE